ncbi:aminotransferase class I/II-fold pyridoxal phosphate-dependent enzyme [Pinirhizobacter sp.]|uniref:aminotransferase class I/II-fold pyridoxal phosphate-dependent enzyme n=1 Tax=Pinirhizobacter sp. TaxID=2950432 RepID=UPI0039C91D7C
MRPSLLAALAAAASKREADGLYRRLRTVDAGDGRHAMVEGRRYLIFGSNDYLGLAHHPDVVAALTRAIQAGSGAAHLVNGHTREHAALEEALAAWTGREKALLFSTGMMANAGVMQVLLGSVAGSISIQDRLNHASLIDGARAVGAELRRYPHGDADGAARQLALRSAQAALVSTDGVFSMDGDIAPLVELAGICRGEGALLHVDDAHGLGVVGQHGAGSVAAAKLDATDVPVLMGTLGKALGTSGAFVAGSASLIDGLVQFARTYIYTTAMPPALAAASRVAVGLAQAADDRRARLASLVSRFRAGAGQLGLTLLPSATPIQPLILGEATLASGVAAALAADGILATAIRPPTVPAGKARLRLTFSALHEPSDVDRLLDALERAVPGAARGHAVQ